MTVDVLKRDEAVPAAYPTVPSGLSTEAAALDSDFIWERIEAHISHRWTTREVVWVVEGSGDFVPDLSPVDVTSVEIWEDNAWAETTLNARPLGGFWLPGTGPFRFTANVGGGSVPAGVSEAFRRLAEYIATETRSDAHGVPAGVSSYRVGFGEMQISFRRSPEWMARALQQSGAADLLRIYRRV